MLGFEDRVPFERGLFTVFGGMGRSKAFPDKVFGMTLDRRKSDPFDIFQVLGIEFEARPEF